MIKKIIAVKATAILIPTGCIFVQWMTFIVLSPRLASPAGKMEAIISKSFAVLWAFLPLIALFGAYSGIKFIRRNGFSILPAIGIGINALWLLIFLVFWLLIFLGITA